MTPAFSLAAPLRLSLRPPLAVSTRRPLRVPIRAVASEPVTTTTDDKAGEPIVSKQIFDDGPSAIESMEDIHEIIALVEQFGIGDFRLADNGIELEITRPGGRGFENGQLVSKPVSAPVAEQDNYVEEEGEVEEPDSDSEASVQIEEHPEGIVDEDRSDPDASKDSDFVITSNRVGFFLSGARNKPPLVMVGDHVAFNQPVCIIEQLGQQYVYLSEASGTVAKIFVEDGDAVEYGQKVMVIRPD